MAAMVRPLWAKVLIAVGIVLVVLALLLAFFPWDVLRGPVNRYVSEKTGRHFAITRKLDVKLGATTRVLADGLEFANPDWAKDPFLVRAEGGEIDVRLWPLIAHRRIEMPRVVLRKPQLGLQLEEDGRRTWALGRNSRDPKNVPDIGAFVVDEGTVHYIDGPHNADISAKFAVDAPLAVPHVARAASAAASSTPEQKQSVEQANEPGALPLSFQAQGTWEKESFTARGRTGNILYLSAPLQKPFPMEIDAAAGATRLQAKGAIASLATLEGSDAVVDLQGHNLADLYKLLGVVLPATPQYAVHGHVKKDGDFWRLGDLRGKLGNTDLSGELSYDKRQDKPHLAGTLHSKWLDFKDLAPIIGMSEKQQQDVKVQAEAPEKKGLFGHTKTVAPKDPNRKVLPHERLDLARLQKMNSDVAYSAAKVTNLKQLPVDSMAFRVRLQDGLLKLDDVKLGVAGGTMTGSLKVDGHVNPALAELHLDARSLELKRLLKKEELIKSSFGKIYGDFELKGRGNSVAQMLGTAEGNAALMMGPGQISNLLLEIAGLDGGEIIKFLTGGDVNVRVRCGATAFDVKNGLMTSRALVFDTVDTIIYGDGNINLGTEKLDLYFRPYPKDTSILSLRSPIQLVGTLGAPKAGPDKAALGGRAGIALALGAINPLLALAATIETGPGKDANCGAILRDASSPDAHSRMDAMAQAQQQATSAMGGPGTKLRNLLGLGGRKPGERGGRDESPRSAAPGRKPAEVPPQADGNPHAPGAADKPYGN